MENFLNTLNEKINFYHLLKHKFYKDWNSGKLNIEILKEYSKQYFHHVNAFPRCISSVHSNCEDLKNRQILLYNLLEEENKDESHPQLWLNFASGLGASVDEIKNVKLNQETKDFIKEFLEITKNSYAAGLGALYAYEKQVPEVAESKINGLAKFYGVNDPEVIKFFVVHIEADKWHSQEVLGLLSGLSTEEERKMAILGCEKLAKLMWSFLSGIERETKHMLN